MSKVPFHSSRLAPFAVAILLCATPALAADRAKSSEAQAAYARDRAECMKKDREDRATCLQEATRGGLSNEQAQFESNRLARCDNQPATDRDECVRRMNEGTTSGSVKDGAVVRELRTVVPGK